MSAAVGSHRLIRSFRYIVAFETSVTVVKFSFIPNVCGLSNTVLTQL